MSAGRRDIVTIDWPTYLAYKIDFQNISSVIELSGWFQYENVVEILN